MRNHLVFFFFFFFFFSFFFLRLGLGQRRAVVIIGRWLLPSLVDTGDICCHYWQHILVYVVLLVRVWNYLTLPASPIVIFMLFYWYECGTILPRRFPPLYHLYCFTDTRLELSYLAGFPHCIIYVVLLVQVQLYYVKWAFPHCIIYIVLSI